MTTPELHKAFFHRLAVIYTPIHGEPMKYQYIEGIEYATDRFNKFELGLILHNRKTVTHVSADRVEVEDEKERESANTRPIPFKLPENFEKYKEAFLKCRPVVVTLKGKDKFYPRITKLTVKLDWYGDFAFTVTVGKDTDTIEVAPENVKITSYGELIGENCES